MQRECPAVVLDTNVIVAAGFHPSGHAARVISAGRNGALRTIWSEATRRETRAILGRIPPLDWKSFEDLFRSKDAYDRPVDLSLVSAVPDPEDRKFAGLARASGAVLITADDELLASSARIGILALAPHEFLLEWPCEPGPMS
jgi:predicted nucleic acid-binding protein